MTVLPIEKGVDNKILRAVSEPVKKIDKKLFKLLDDMRDTMFAAKGVGLAAPQVGVNIRAVICTFNYDTVNETVVDMINPAISSLSEEMVKDEEGCLSVPGKFDFVKRHKSLIVRFTDRKGREQALKVSGYNAKVVQHEIDHINGILFVDKAEPKVNVEE